MTIRKVAWISLVAITVVLNIDVSLSLAGRETGIIEYLLPIYSLPVAIAVITVTIAAVLFGGLWMALRKRWAALGILLLGGAALAATCILINRKMTEESSSEANALVERFLLDPRRYSPTYDGSASEAMLTSATKRGKLRRVYASPMYGRYLYRVGGPGEDEIIVALNKNRSGPRFIVLTATEFNAPTKEM